MTRFAIAAALALAVTLPAVTAQAQSPRTFVSAAGSDSNPCSFAAPCRHFQAAVNATSAGGEVDALDPAGYGPITISHAITIEGQGWSYIAPPASGNGITINAVSGNVTIRGVSLNGVGITGNPNGIVFNSGSSLTVTNCIVQNFAGNVVAGGIGIMFNPVASASGLIDHVVATNNQFGISIFGSLSATSTVAISNSIASDNSQIGILIVPGITSTVSIDNVSANGNTRGIDGESPAIVTLGRSVVTGNTNFGIENGTSNTFYSYQDNRIDGNTAGNIDGALNYSRALK
jgi:hypothetical protein